MADKTLNTRIQQKADTSSNWTSSNPVLLRGELGFETDTLKFKIGNGTSNYNSLEYFPAVSSITIQGDGGAILVDSSAPITESGTRKVSHATTAGYKHIPAGGSSGQVLIWSSSGTATWGTLADDDTTYTFTGGTNSFTVTPSNGSPQTVNVTPSIGVATTSSNGLMSSSDKTKLNGLSNYTLPAATTGALGGVRIGYSETGQNYPVELNASNQMYVNVPWQNTTYTFTGGTNKFTVTPSNGSAQTVNITPSINNATTSTAGLMSSSDKTKLDGLHNYTLPVATDTDLGGVKIGYTENGRNYPVELDSDNRMFVNVPWTSSSITYTFAGTEMGFTVTPSNGEAQTVNITIPDATTTEKGLMTPDDKKALNNLGAFVLGNDSLVLKQSTTNISLGSKANRLLVISDGSSAKTYEGVEDSIILDATYTSSTGPATPTSKVISLGSGNSSYLDTNVLFVGNSLGSSSAGAFNNCLFVGNNISRAAYMSYANAAGIGQGLIIGGNQQTVVGKYNTSSSDALFLVGKGTSASARSNAFIVSATDITLNVDTSINAPTFVDNSLTVENDFECRSNATLVDVNTRNITSTGNISAEGTITSGGTAVALTTDIPKFYVHYISLKKAGTPYVDINTTIINRSSTAYTLSTFLSYVTSNFTSTTKYLPATGSASNTSSNFTTNNIVKGMYYSVSSVSFYFDTCGTSPTSSGDPSISGEQLSMTGALTDTVVEL